MNTTTQAPIVGIAQEANVATTDRQNTDVGNFISTYNVHATANGMFYFKYPGSTKWMSLKKKEMMLRFRPINNYKAWQKFIDALQEEGRVKDSVHYGSNPPPNSFVITSAERQTTLLDTVLNNIFNEWNLGHFVTAEALQYYRAVGGSGFKNESSFGKAIKKFVTDNSVEGWDHKRTGFQIGDEKHLVGWINTCASDDNFDITIMRDRKNRDWGIVHRITSQALVRKLSVDFRFD